MASAIKAHRAEHGCSLEVACEALGGRFWNAGAETLRKAWQEMSPLLEMDQVARDALIAGKILEARGLAKVTKRER
jgi:hypothetical protein